MSINKIISIGIIVLLASQGHANDFLFESVKTSPKCVDKGGYWYHDKCWKDYDKEAIPASKIDSLVSSQMKIIKKTTIKVNNHVYPLSYALPIEKDGGIFLFALYNTKEQCRTLLLRVKDANITNGTFEAQVRLYNGDKLAGTSDEQPAMTGSGTMIIADLDKWDIEIKGEVSDKNSRIKKVFDFKINEAISGAGNSHIKIKGDEAYLSGVLGTVAYAQIRDLVTTHPKVKTIVMTHISGSINDAVNMHTGRLIRKHGLTTKVLSSSDIASGGVDLFCAGKKRIVEKGAKIGVHSWCCINGMTAIEIPKDHPAHQYQLNYFTMAFGPKRGQGFYFYTLRAAPFDSIHYMTNDEIRKWGVATEFIDK